MNRWLILSLAVGVALFAPQHVLWAQGIAPGQLSCEYLVNPLGLDVPQPRLSWILSSEATAVRGQRQTAYQVLVASSRDRLEPGQADCWDSDRVASDQSTQVVYRGKKLASHQRCYWKVRVWDQAGKASDWSEPAFWTMRILDPKLWTAKWIGYTKPYDAAEQEGTDQAGPSPVFRLERQTAMVTKNWLIGPMIFGAVSCLTTATDAADSSSENFAGSSTPVSQIKVLPDKAPDCSSLKSIVATITRDCASNDAKAIAIYNFMQLAHYHRAYPSEPGGLPVLKEINCYGWSLCGGLHAEQSALWRELGWNWRFVGWDGHTTVEAQYDGQWHYLDAFLKFYAWRPDPNAPGGRTIAGEDELNNKAQELIKEAFILDPARKCVYAKDNQFARYGDQLHWQAPSFLSCGDTLDDLIKGLKTHRRGGADAGWSGIVHASGNYAADVNLRPGWALTNAWDPVPDAWHWAGNQVAPAHTCGGHKDTRNDPGIGLVLEPYVTSKPARSYANGVLACVPDFSSKAILESLAAYDNVTYAERSLRPASSDKPGSVTLELASPYAITKASGEAVGADAVAVSIDGGKTFKPVELANFSGTVKGQVAALVRVEFRTALKSLKLEAVVQNNPGSLPYLSPGKNVVTVSVADPRYLGRNKLVITYAYRLGRRSKSFEQLYDQDKELAKAHDATWDDTVTCVQKTFTAKDLPAKFDIDCPTPRGRYPVYPRMLLVRREVLAPGQVPAATPAPPTQPAVGAGQELLTLPSPWTIGVQSPPKVPTRPTQQTLLPATRTSYVSKQGEVFPHHFVKWLKDSSDASILLTDFSPAKFPAVKDLASARLIVYVEEAHDKAPMEAAAVLLDGPFESGRAYDFAKLGQTVGSTIVAQGKGQPFAPPRRYEIDVTKAVRAWAGGAKSYGLAVRIVPNRGVDDGWTVRFTPAKDQPPELQITTYVGAAPKSH